MVLGDHELGEKVGVRLGEDGEGVGHPRLQRIARPHCADGAVGGVDLEAADEARVEAQPQRGEEHAPVSGDGLLRGVAGADERGHNLLVGMRQLKAVGFELGQRVRVALLADLRALPRHQCLDPPLDLRQRLRGVLELGGELQTVALPRIHPFGEEVDDLVVVALDGVLQRRVAHLRGDVMLGAVQHQEPHRLEVASETRRVKRGLSLVVDDVDVSALLQHRRQQLQVRSLVLFGGRPSRQVVKDGGPFGSHRVQIQPFGLQEKQTHLVGLRVRSHMQCCPSSGVSQLQHPRTHRWRILCGTFIC